VLRHAALIRETLDPRYECRHCRNDHVRDLPKGCPSCPLTIAGATLYDGWSDYAGLRADWDYFYPGADPDDLERHEPEFVRLLSRVLDAVATSGERPDPRWSPEFAAAVAGYRAEAAYIRRERDFAEEERMRAAARRAGG
jgi:hypothetical protein